MFSLIGAFQTVTPRGWPNGFAKLQPIFKPAKSLTTFNFIVRLFIFAPARPLPPQWLVSQKRVQR